MAPAGPFPPPEALKVLWEIASGNLVSVSERQLVDCSKQNSGCNGSLTDYASAYCKTVDVDSESSCPYAARDGTCKNSVRFYGFLDTTELYDAPITGAETWAERHSPVKILGINYSYKDPL